MTGVGILIIILGASAGSGLATVCGSLVLGVGLASIAIRLVEDR